MIDRDRIVKAGGASAGAADKFLAQAVAAFDEHLAEALSGGDSKETIERVRALGLSKTADRLRLARGQFISIRTREGLATARAAGRTGGRRPKLTQRQVAQVRKMLADGETITAIADVLGVARSTVYRVLGSTS